MGELDVFKDLLASGSDLGVAAIFYLLWKNNAALRSLDRRLLKVELRMGIEDDAENSKKAA